MPLRRSCGPILVPCTVPLVPCIVSLIQCTEPLVQCSELLVSSAPWPAVLTRWLNQGRDVSTFHGTGRQCTVSLVLYT